MGIILRENKELSLCKSVIKPEDLWTLSYNTFITDDDRKDLKLGFSSMKLDICGDPPEIKEVLKVWIAEKMRIIRITADKIEKPPINSIGTRPKNTLVKRTGKKKSPSTIVGLLRQLQPNIRQMLMEINIVVSILHLMQLSPLFREDTSRIIRVP